MCTYTRGMSSPKRPPVLFSLLAPRLVKWYSKSNVAIYRATGGRVGGRELGLPLCLLTTTGRKSGLPRTSALAFMPDGDRIVLVAAQGGLPTHPHWLLNLCANPEVHVQIRSEIRTMGARVVDDAERAQLWPRLVAMNPRWARFQSWTDRVIPVVVCEPA
jgi:F420H(2)-dependent quinone reductase